MRFSVAANAITMLPDSTRRTPVVDPDDHHLLVSLGCALENMAQASLPFVLKSQAQFDTDSNALTVVLDPTKTVVSPLYRAISARQCARSLYDSKTVSTPDLKLLESAGTGIGVSVLVFTPEPEMEKILELALQGNTTQLSDAAFVKELKQWLRFSASEAVKTADGLYSITSGNPSVPRWLGSPMFDLMVTAKSENDKYAEHARSSAGIAVFVSSVNNRNHWIEAGRCYERFALQPTSMVIRTPMLNKAVEVPAMRQQLEKFLSLKAGRPDLVVRFGREPVMAKSLRRDVSAVLV